MAQITAITLLLMVVSMGWEIHQEREQAHAEMREQAAVMAQQLLATRAFIAQKQEVINRDSRGNFEFKRLNPAAVGRGVGHIFKNLTGTDYEFKQTRLNPRNPVNAPDAFERKMLERFAAQPQLHEVWGEDLKEGRRVFRYMIPLYAEETCLPCHGEPAGSLDVAGYSREGYRPGELAGAISVTVPMELFLAGLRGRLLRHGLFTVTLLALTLLLLYLSVSGTVVRPLGELTSLVARFGETTPPVLGGGLRAQGEIKLLSDEFQAMAGRVAHLYATLEEKVQERTRQLAEANLELSRANRVKSDFLAMMSHEFKTPLTSIIAFTELLLDRAKGELTPGQEEYLLDIKESGEELLRLVNDLLDLSRVEAGKLELYLEDFNLETLARGVAKSLAPVAARAGLTVTTSVEGPLPVRADGPKIRQVLLNLVGNAIKFTPAGGRITIAAGQSPSRDTAIVRVTDTGPGIPLEIQPLIFERFHQGDTSNTRLHGGAGLGLALSRHLVEMHGGKIWVESRPGNGASFFFTLPLIPLEGNHERSGDRIEPQDTSAGRG